MENCSERVKKFIEENLPKEEKISGEKILELADKYKLKITDHHKFLVITAENDNEAGLVLAKEPRQGGWGGPIWRVKDVINLEYSVENATITTYPIEKKVCSEVKYSPHLGKGAILLGRISGYSLDFWNFWNEIYSPRIEIIRLPENVISFPTSEGQKTIFLSEMSEHIARLK